MKQRGFTLLEVLIATLIMAIAVTGLMSALSTSLRSASRLTDYDRAALLAHQKMDELMIETRLPINAPLEGSWGPEVTGGLNTGWRARITAFEAPPGATAGTPFLERIELLVWWTNADRQRTFALDGYRRAVLTQADINAGVGK